MKMQRETIFRGMKINVKRYGIIHYCAQCKNCDWDANMLSEDTFSTQDVRSATRKHVKQTGHTVTIESGASTDYSL